MIIIDPWSFIFLFLSALCMYASYRYQVAIYKKTGLIFEKYPYEVKIFFAPVYEEILFRGIILLTILSVTDPSVAILSSSLVFGVWHVKNLTYQSATATVYQVLYTGLLLGPILAVATIWWGDISIAILLHALNNYLAPISQKLVGKSMRDLFR